MKPLWTGFPAPAVILAWRRSKTLGEHLCYGRFGCTIHPCALYGVTLGEDLYILFLCRLPKPMAMPLKDP